MAIVRRCWGLCAAVVAFAALAALALSTTASVYAASLPTGFTETRVAAGLGAPTALAVAPDGRIFITVQNGSVRVVKNGALLATPFLTLTTDSTGERGLLGIAFDPNFATNHYVYVYHTVAGSPPHNRISRYVANGDVTDGTAPVPILDLENLSAGNHNGGAIHFGPDGKLYVAVGENAVSSNAQTLGNRLGKILRLNADGSIPSDNPFIPGNGSPVTASGTNQSIWAYGLRNPFTFSFQPGTGRMFINDVGQSTWEEINDGLAGSNYGWPTCEGSCSNSNFVNPLSTYSHSDGCAIVGSTFYNPATFTFPGDYAGDYFFADLCSGWIRRYDQATSTVQGFAAGLSSPVDLTFGTDGALYYLARGAGGELWRVQYTAATSTPTATNTRTATATNTRTATATNTPTATTTNTNAPTATASNTPTATATAEASATATESPTATATAEATATATATPSSTPTETELPTITAAPTETPLVPTAVPTSTPVRNGKGLRGKYFGKKNLTQPKFTRRDAQIDFQWGKGSPAPSLAPNTFSVRWRGFILPAYTERYTFIASSDDGIRVWLNEQIVIDNWRDGVWREASGTFDLVAGAPATIRIEYYEARGAAAVRLEWSSPSQPREIIPKARLFPPATKW